MTGDGCGGVISCGTCSVIAVLRRRRLQPVRRQHRPRRRTAASRAPRPPPARRARTAARRQTAAAGLIPCGSCTSPQFCGGGGPSMCGGNNGLASDGGVHLHARPPPVPRARTAAWRRTAAAASSSCGSCTSPAVLRRRRPERVRRQQRPHPRRLAASARRPPAPPWATPAASRATAAAASSTARVCVLPADLRRRRRRRASAAATTGSGPDGGVALHAARPARASRPAPAASRADGCGGVTASCGGCTCAGHVRRRRRAQPVRQLEPAARRRQPVHPRDHLPRGHELRPGGRRLRRPHQLRDLHRARHLRRRRRAPGSAATAASAPTAGPVHADHLREARLQLRRGRRRLRRAAQLRHLHRSAVLRRRRRTTSAAATTGSTPTAAWPARRPPAPKLGYNCGVKRTTAAAGCSTCGDAAPARSTAAAAATTSAAPPTCRPAPAAGPRPSAGYVFDPGQQPAHLQRPGLRAGRRRGDPDDGRQHRQPVVRLLRSARVRLGVHQHRRRLHPHQRAERRDHGRGVSSASGSASSPRTSRPARRTPRRTAPYGSHLTLPSTHLQGNIPRFAVDTGAVDSMECVLSKMGIATTEFVDPAIDGNGVPTAAGRVHLYQGSIYLGGAIIDGNTPTEDALTENASVMDSYDVVLFPCQGSAGSYTAAERLAQHARQPDHLRQLRRARLRHPLPLRPPRGQRDRQRQLRGHRDVERQPHRLRRVLQ